MTASNIDKKKRLRLLNKWALGIFLVFIFITIILKIIDGLLLDFGFREGKFHIGYWKDPNWSNGIPAYEKMVTRHPNVVWMLTQFTWLTTFLIFIIMFFRFFQYGPGVPRWLRWSISQRTLTLVTMYDGIVGIVFWGTIFKSFNTSFNPSLREFEIMITVFVHAIIPIALFVYATIYLIRDKKASFLKEMFILKGMIFPIIYIIYYFVMAIGWSDPYPVTNIQNDILGEIWKLPVAIFGLYALLCILLLFHNFILLKFNKFYDLKNDYEIKRRLKLRTEKFIEKENRRERRRIK